jgi:hypothetical protein
VVVDAAVVGGRFELLPVPGVHYHAFCDPSGGSSDSMTLAIAHREADKVVIDHISEQRPPFQPDQCVQGFCAMLRAFGITSIQSDKYAGAWVVERFAKHGVRVEQSAKPKSDLYGELLPLMNSGRIELLDNKRLMGQLCGLERTVARSGKDSIDHAPGAHAHDDIANCVAGVAAMVALGHRGVVCTPETLARIMAMPPRRQNFGPRRNYFIPSPGQRQQPFVSADKLQKESAP